MLYPVFPFPPFWPPYLRVCSCASLSARVPTCFCFCVSRQRAQALVQHHDGVTGTSKQHVADDYAQRLDHAWVRVEAAVSAALSRLAFGEVRDRDGSPGDVDGDFTRLRQCRLANVSICDITVEVRAGGR